jgi:hypothetical protein
MSFKKIALFFLHGAGKYENRKFHVPARCAGWLQEISLYVGWFSVRLLGEIGKMPLK